ncbi:hypothetical protein G9F32_06950 [Acinetobacter sp. 194]|uniref:hypothetical protein n=1 Tax=Acinetobacter shaoyimingii TaxID=2715164 RepID=UPI00140781CA|nr:hypothetical protein [Acinetobacter shaoyimingii]NHB57769.1 hypothetical protein [Acinetobacter shaoyimingii]
MAAWMLPQKYGIGCAIISAKGFVTFALSKVSYRLRESLRIKIYHYGCMKTNIEDLHNIGN